MTSFSNPDRDLALPYAPSAQRGGYRALWAFDEILAQIVASTREPMLGEIKLRWWAEQLENNKRDAAPILSELTVPLDHLTSLVDGWTALLQPLPLSVPALDKYATGRGATLFGATTPQGADSAALKRCGEGWALADFAYRCDDTQTRLAALEMARTRITRAGIGDVARHSKPHAILADLARWDIQVGYPRRHPAGSRRRALRVLRYSLFGSIY